MTVHHPCKTTLFRKGITLIELTVVILVFLSLVTLLMMGARAWKQGSDRASCTMQIRQMQVALRSYSNINDLKPGDDVSPKILQAELIGTGLFLHTTPVCPGGGIYGFGGNVIPEIGDLYMTCSLAVSRNHIPDTYSNW